MKDTNGAVAAAFPPTTGADVSDGDIAILKFLAAAELVEDDLWHQYCELVVGYRFFVARATPSIRH
jgi:hypothetical protein